MTKGSGLLVFGEEYSTLTWETYITAFCRISRLHKSVLQHDIQ
jgi:hypothetical protein